MEINKKFLSLVVASTIFSNINLMANEIMEPTSIDQIDEIITSDQTLNKRVSLENISKARKSIYGMNSLIKEAIKAEGLANDGIISIADTREINHYLVENHASNWKVLRGEKAGDNSTGYGLVEAKRSKTIAMNANAVRIWGNIYNLGFESYNKKRLSNSKGEKSSSFTSVGYYLGEILKNDIESGKLNNPNFQEISGTTGTKLDMIIGVILNDTGLLRKISTGDLREGAKSADKLNHLIVEAIKAEGLGNDGKLTTADIRTINRYLVENHLEEWAELHGDDERDEETGYHLVQNDGAYSRMFADNVINSIADGIYHLGFETDKKNRLLNEDGNANKRFEKVAWWLDTSLKDNLIAGKFNNPEYTEVIGTTGTSFDKMIPYIYNDEGLLLNVSMDDIREGARSANGMNELIIEAIKETGVASDDYISVDDTKILNHYLVTNYASVWSELHGDDEENEETGYHRIQNDGARGIMNGRNTINNLADGIYHLGFETPYSNRLVNEDGNKNVSFRNVSYWMNRSLQEDYAKGTFR